MENKFQVGEKVNVKIQEIPYIHRLGGDVEFVEGVITRHINVDDNQRGEYAIDIDLTPTKTNSYELGFYESELEAIEPENTLKNGDRVRVLTDNPLSSVLKKGDIGIVGDYRSDYSFRVDVGDDKTYANRTSSKYVEKIEEYTGSDAENEFLYTGGETVEVIDCSEAYEYYSDLANKMGLPNFVEGDEPKTGAIGTVVGYLPHEDEDKDQICGVDIDGQQYLISIDGLKKVDLSVHTITFETPNPVIEVGDSVIIKNDINIDMTNTVQDMVDKAGEVYIVEHIKTNSRGNPTYKLIGGDNWTWESWHIELFDNTEEEENGFDIVGKLTFGDLSITSEAPKKLKSYTKTKYVAQSIENPTQVQLFNKRPNEYNWDILEEVEYTYTK
jgi:ribosomal protein S17